MAFTLARHRLVFSIWLLVSAVQSINAAAAAHEKIWRQGGSLLAGARRTLPSPNLRDNHLGTGNLSSSDLAATLPASLAELASSCRCSFSGRCSCDVAVAFMKCIADACHAGSCKCHSLEFVQACGLMADTCPGIGLSCTSERARCTTTGAVVENLEAKAMPDPVPAAPAATTTAAATVKSATASNTTRARPQRLRPGDLLPLVPGRTAERTKGATLGERFWMMIEANLFFFVALFVVAYFYDGYRRQLEFPLIIGAAPAETGKGFSFGLCGCLEDISLCCFAWCCPVLRWADSMDKSNSAGDDLFIVVGHRFPAYWNAILIMAGLLLAEIIVATVLLLPWTAAALCFFITGVGAVYRHRLRRRYGLESDTAETVIEDCFAWWCCTCCAIIQEAREVEHALKKPRPKSAAVREVVEQKLSPRSDRNSSRSRSSSPARAASPASATKPPSTGSGRVTAQQSPSHNNRWAPGRPERPGAFVRESLSARYEEARATPCFGQSSVSSKLRDSLARDD